MAKAIRRLTDIKFDQEGAHVALVGKHQGGPANGITTLITKATDHIDPVVVEKAATVTVSMQFPEFLRKFFGMYWEDSEVLSATLGYGMTDEFDWENKTYQDYLDSKVQSISIMKSVYKAQDVSKALAELSPEAHLTLLQDQEMLEKAMSSVLPEGESLNDKHTGESDVETILKSAHEEFVTKAVAEAIAPVQKALDEQTAVLKAAQDKLAQYAEAEALAVTKSRTDALVAAGVASDRVETLMKALAPLDEEAFKEAVDAMSVLKALADDSDMLRETGVSGMGAEDPKEVDRTSEILKAKYAKPTV